MKLYMLLNCWVCDITGPPSLLQTITTEVNGCVNVRGNVLDTDSKETGIVAHAANT